MSKLLWIIVLIMVINIAYALDDTGLITVNITAERPVCYLDADQIFTGHNTFYNITIYNGTVLTTVNNSDYLDGYDSSYFYPYSNPDNYWNHCNNISSCGYIPAGGTENYVPIFDKDGYLVESNMYENPAIPAMYYPNEFYVGEELQVQYTKAWYTTALNILTVGSSNEYVTTPLTIRWFPYNEETTIEGKIESTDGSGNYTSWKIKNMESHNIIGRADYADRESCKGTVTASCEDLDEWTCNYIAEYWGSCIWDSGSCIEDSGIGACTIYDGVICTTLGCTWNKSMENATISGFSNICYSDGSQCQQSGNSSFNESYTDTKYIKNNTVGNYKAIVTNLNASFVNATDINVTNQIISGNITVVNATISNNAKVTNNLTVNRIYSGTGASGITSGKSSNSYYSWSENFTANTYPTDNVIYVNPIRNEGTYSAWGMRNNVYKYGIYNLTSTYGLRAIQNQVEVSGNGTVSEVTANNNFVACTGVNGKITSAYGMSINPPTVSNGCNITNVYGVYVFAQKANDNVSTAYAYYQSGKSDLNYFAGKSTFFNYTTINNASATNLNITNTLNVTRNIYGNNLNVSQNVTILGNNNSLSMPNLVKIDGVTPCADGDALKWGTGGIIYCG